MKRTEHLISRQKRKKEGEVEDVRDSMAQGNADIPMPEWQKRELEKRYKEYKAGRQDLHDWQSVHEEIRKKYR